MVVDMVVANAMHHGSFQESEAVSFAMLAPKGPDISNSAELTGH